MCHLCIYLLFNARPGTDVSNQFWRFRFFQLTSSRFCLRDKSSTVCTTSTIPRLPAIYCSPLPHIFSVCLPVVLLPKQPRLPSMSCSGVWGSLCLPRSLSFFLLPLCGAGD